MARRAVPRLTRVAGSAFAALTALSVGDRSSAQNQWRCEFSRPAVVGCVLAVQGTWTLTSGGERMRTLAPGSPLPPGGMVQTPAPTAPDSFLHLLYDDYSVSRLTCGGGRQCPGVVAMPARSRRERAGLRSLLLESALALWSLSPARFESLLSRADTLTDDVVRLRHGTLDLTGLFAGAPPGHYTVSVTPVGALAGARAAVVRPFHWDRSGAVLLVGAWLPGVYQVQLATTGAGRSEPAATAYVAAIDDERFADASAQFASMVSILDGWGGAVSGVQKAALRRAALESLAGVGR